MGQLTTHVLDISAGLPAAGLRIEAHSWLAETPTLIASVATGSDGRLAKPLVAGADFLAGRYTLTFYVASYFRARGVNPAGAGLHRGSRDPNRYRASRAALPRTAVDRPVELLCLSGWIAWTGFASSSMGD